MKKTDTLFDKVPDAVQENPLTCAVPSLAATAALVMVVFALIIPQLQTETQTILALSTMSLILLGATARFLAEIIIWLWGLVKELDIGRAKTVMHGVMLVVSAAAVLGFIAWFIVQAGDGMVVLTPSQLTQLLGRLVAEI